MIPYPDTLGGASKSPAFACSNQMDVFGLESLCELDSEPDDSDYLLTSLELDHPNMPLRLNTY